MNYCLRICINAFLTTRLHRKNRFNILMSLESIVEYLKQSTGLDSNSVGLPVVEKAIQNRMEACGIKDYSVYFKTLNSSPTELQALINEVMVPETWFFRGKELFDYLRAYILREWTNKPSQQDATLRVLTIPCSTGEEPYSVAIALKECRLAPDKFTIDAIDIATISLDIAKKGVYTDHSFRGTDSFFRNHYFKKTAGGYHLNREIKELVSFSHGNLFTTNNADNTAIYDIIFCRNLLIYFDRDTQRKAVKTLHSQLSANGILFVGHAEAGCLLDQNYQSLGVPNVFAFSKTSKQARTPCLKAPTPPTTRQHKPDAKTRRGRLSNDKKISSQAGIIRGEQILNEARRLADEGQLIDAGNKCKESINVDGASAEAFYLMGVILDAQGNRGEAKDLYKRALYLYPNHYKSLIHLASHAERQGELGKAKIYRKRAEKSMNMMVDK